MTWWFWFYILFIYIIIATVGYLFIEKNGYVKQLKHFSLHYITILYAQLSHAQSHCIQMDRCYENKVP